MDLFGRKGLAAHLSLEHVKRVGAHPTYGPLWEEVLADTCSEGQALRKVDPEELAELHVAYGFGALLTEFFARRGAHPDSLAAGMVTGIVATGFGVGFVAGPLLISTVLTILVAAVALAVIVPRAQGE